MDEIEKLLAIPEDAITDAEAEEIRTLWGRAECSASGYYYEKEKVKYELKIFYQSIVQRGELFCLKAFKFVRDECVGYVPFDDYYLATLSSELDRIITALEGTIKKIEAGEIKRIRVVSTEAEETTSKDTTDNEGDALEALRRENTALRAELKALKSNNAGLQAGGDTDHREELELLRAELEKKDDEIEALKEQIPKNGRKSNSGLNRHERASLLLELIANLSGLEVDTLTGENANIQRQGAPSLGRVCELITNISEGQGTRVVSDLRTGNRVGRDTKLVAERTHLEALLGDIRELKGW